GVHTYIEASPTTRRILGPTGSAPLHAQRGLHRGHVGRRSRLFCRASNSSLLCWLRTCSGRCHRLGVALSIWLKRARQTSRWTTKPIPSVRLLEMTLLKIIQPTSDHMLSVSEPTSTFKSSILCSGTHVLRMMNRAFQRRSCAGLSCPSAPVSSPNNILSPNISQELASGTCSSGTANQFHTCIT